MKYGVLNYDSISTFLVSRIFCKGLGRQTPTVGLVGAKPPQQLCSSRINKHHWERARAVGKRDHVKHLKNNLPPFHRTQNEAILDQKAVVSVDLITLGIHRVSRRSLQICNTGITAVSNPSAQIETYLYGHLHLVPLKHIAIFLVMAFLLSPKILRALAPLSRWLTALS